MKPEMKLYVKVWCPWCVRATQWLDAHGYQYQLIDIESIAGAAEEMERISGQRKVPTLVAGDKVLPDFGPPELETFLKTHSINP